jgi:hypothetical protein
MMSNESYQHGFKHGQWTLKLVKECGWKTPQECLANAENVYRKEVNNLPELYRKNPAYAAKHAQYLEGYITAERQSLGALITSN